MIQSCYPLSHQSSHLLRVVVVQVGNDLHGDVRLSGAWRPHHQREAGIHTGPNGLHLLNSRIKRTGGVGRGEFDV